MSAIGEVCVEDWVEIVLYEARGTLKEVNSFLEEQCDDSFTSSFIMGLVLNIIAICIDNCETDEEKEDMKFQFNILTNLIQSGSINWR